MAEPVLDALLNQIAAAERILLVTHEWPDGDAIGSLLGLARLLRRQGKQVTPACQDPPPASLDFVPGVEQIVTQASGPFDLVIGLDASDRRRLGRLLEAEALAGAPLINVDHHVTNVNFGSLNWVDPTSVATAQMVLKLAEYAGWPVDAEVATCLLTGLVTDTRAFRTANVDAAALNAALRLIQAGASLVQVTQLALSRRPLATVRLWGEAIGRLQFEDGLLWTYITQEMRQANGVSANGESGLSNLLADVREAEVVVVFTERDGGEIDVSMRTVPGRDVAGVALALGGGGHPQAAGCTLPGPLAAVEPRVLAAVRRALAEQRKNEK